MKIGRITIPISGHIVILEDLELTLDELDEIIKGAEKLIVESKKPISGMIA